MACTVYVKINNKTLEFTEPQFILFLIARGAVTNLSSLIELVNSLHNKSIVRFNTDGVSTLLKVLDSLKAIGDKNAGKYSDIKAAKEAGVEYIIDKKAITPLLLLNTEEFLTTVMPTVVKKDDARYREYKAMQLVKIPIGGDISEEEQKKLMEEALQKADNIMAGWETISDDSITLRTIITSAMRLQTSDPNKLDFSKIESKFLQQDIIKSGIVSLAQSINYSINSIMQNLSNSGERRYLSNFLVEGKVEGFAAPLLMHVDRAYIGSDGSVHIFNLRFSHNKAEDWSFAQSENYKYLMAMLKQILRQNGVTGDIFLYEIPVTILYDSVDGIDNWNLITGVSRDNTNSGVSITVDGIKRDSDNLTVLNHNGILNYNIDKSNKSLLYKYTHKVKRLIVEPTIIKGINENLRNEVQQQLTALMPIGDLETEGVKISATTWIRKNKSSAIVQTDNGYEIDFGTGEKDKVHIDDSTFPPEKNQKIIEEVMKHMELINSGNPIVMASIVNEFKQNIKNGTTEFSSKSFRFNPYYLTNCLKEYLLWEPMRDLLDEEGNPVRYYPWKLQEDDLLTECRIMLLKNEKTKQIDIIVPSPFDVQERIPLKAKRTNILGNFLTDMQALGVMKADYGNLEIIRALFLINTMIEKGCFPKDFLLGNIKVVTPNNEGTGRFRSIQQMLPHFRLVINLLNKLPDFLINNNLANAKCISWTDSILNLRRSLLSSTNSLKTEDFLKSEEFDNFENAKNIAGKLRALYALMENCTSLLNLYGMFKMDILKKEYSNPSSNTKYLLASLYFDIAKAINFYSGINEFKVEDINLVERYAMPQYANANSNLRLVHNIYTKALDDTAKKFNEIYSPIRNAIAEYYDAIGFSKLKAATYGSAAKLFENMYQRDANNNILLYFKNPYDLSNNLTLAERKFLKIALFTFAKFRALRNDTVFNYSNPDDPRLQSFITTLGLQYFQVPLEKADIATRRSLKIEPKLNKMKTTIGNFFKDPIAFLNEKNLQLNEQRASELNIIKMSYTNPFSRFEGTSGNANRSKMITEHGVNYFETNIENLLADYTEKFVLSEELNKALFKTKAILLELHLLGEEEGHNLYQQSINEIEDYLNVNVFNKSINDLFGDKVVDAFKIPKELMSKMYITLNLKSGVRDCFEGLWQNYARTITKFLTGIDYKSVSKGYKTVVENCFKNERDINIISELCLRYRLSNTDLARIAERAKLSRGGIFNKETFEYSTLRAPDFLNRMVLFVAQCHMDGVYEAFSIDPKTNSLKYDWKKDKRFSIYAKGELYKNDPEYKKLKGLYMSMIRMYNLEHLENPIQYTDDLPEPYSLAEVKKFVLVSNSIYGAYDKSLKAKLENVAIGQVFGTFSTWFNGHLANWFRRPGEYDEYFEIKHKRNPQSGNLLYMDNSGAVYEEVVLENGKSIMIDPDTKEEAPEGEYVPLYDKIPILVLGIFYTFKELTNELLASDGNLKEAWDNVFSSEINVRNRKKANWDLLIFLLFGALFKYLLEGTYKDFLKNSDVEDIIKNGIIEVLYKAGSSSYDGFGGLATVGNYILNDTNPMAANASITLTKDLISVVTGQKTLGNVAVKDIPIVRTFSNTYKKYYKAHSELNNKTASSGGGGASSRF